MQTTHTVHISDARILNAIPDNSVDLIVTSPPYPMIAMWDALFSMLSADARQALLRNDGIAAFEAMHGELDKVWKECFRVLRNGCFACINIGDATRTIGKEFRLFPNHARVIRQFETLGFHCMPMILWRKQTNAPNKFMGSGMLPAGAYVTLEHEYILIFRKGAKKQFTTKAEKARRMKSALFWEERNVWFSDIWDFKGIKQALDQATVRNRSGAFPFELAYRIVNMFSLYEDTVLDPFAGTGTTMLASMACGRGSVGVEIEGAFAPLILEQGLSFAPAAGKTLAQRIAAHVAFMDLRRKTKGAPRYTNKPHGFPVVTRQEAAMELYTISEIVKTGGQSLGASYEAVPYL